MGLVRAEKGNKMQRLIDANEILKSEHQRYDYMSDEYYVLVRDIENAPTVDPVVHAHWKVVSTYVKKMTRICECSACGDTIWVYADENREWNFCPRCGAKMDEVE